MEEGILPTYAVPVHIPASDVPSMTLQYDPAGRPVWNVVVHALSALLIATKPSEPVFTQHVSEVPGRQRL